MKDMFWSLLVNFIYIIRLLVDKTVDTALEWYLGEKKRCPDLKKDFFVTKSAVEVAEMIRKGDVTSYQVVNAYVNRIIETNPVLNAIIDGPFMDALDEATEIDDRIAKNLITDQEFKEKPFLGVPFTTKDSTAVGGRLHTLGIVSRKTVKSKEDAECVKLMKEAGAIIIATTSIPEVNRWLVFLWFLGQLLGSNGISEIKVAGAEFCQKALLSQQTTFHFVFQF